MAEAPSLQPQALPFSWDALPGFQELEGAREAAEQQMQQKIQEKRTQLAHLLANFYILERISRAQRQCGGERELRKKAYVALVLKRLWEHTRQELHSALRELKRVQAEKASFPHDPEGLFSLSPSPWMLGPRPPSVHAPWLSQKTEDEPLNRLPIFQAP